MPLTPEAKSLLAETIRGTAQAPERGLRARLLRAIHDEADRKYRLSVSIDEAGLDEAHRRRRERIDAWIDERTRGTKVRGDLHEQIDVPGQHRVDVDEVLLRDLRGCVAVKA